MTKELVSVQKNTLQTLGEIANFHAQKTVFQDYREKQTTNTFRRQKADIALFVEYVNNADASITLSVDVLLFEAAAWQDITHGLVKGFVKWMLAKGYAIGSINVRLATVKAHCRLAYEAHTLPESEYSRIKLVKGYTHADGRNIDKKREVTRIGKKKATPTRLTPVQANALKYNHPDTPQGKRDALLMCILLDLGLRCGEIAALKKSYVDMEHNTITFYRQKVDKVQTLRMTQDIRFAMTFYLEVCTSETALIMGSRKNSKLYGAMNEQNITARVNELGERIGIHQLSAHDGRHYWTDAAIRGKSDLRSLQDAGGWNSIAMPARYQTERGIANEGIVLG